MAVNFGELIRLEPRLLSLLNEAAMIEKKGKSWAQLNGIWYRDFKHRMEHLVGMYINEDGTLLSSSAAYDCAYATIYSCLVGN